MRPGGTTLLRATAVLILIALTRPATAKHETKTYTINTADGPVTVTETKVTETSSSPSEFSSGMEMTETSGWSSSTKDLLKDSKVSDMSAGDLGGTLVLAIDKSAISKGLKKYIMDAMKKLPVATKAIKIGLVEYTDRPYTVVSLKRGWSLDRIMARLQRELTKSRHAKRGGKIYDYVGIQAAYNELQKFGKSSAPRIVMLLSSGKDANTAKTEKWRHKLMKEWISLSEIVVDSSSGSFSVKEGDKETSTDKTLEKSTFLTSLLMSYSHSTIEYYKKIYGEVWEFYIVLKHYKKLYPHSWKTHLKTWFTNKYGGSTKFETYLHRTEGNTGGQPISPEQKMRTTFKKKYGSAWEKHFLIWKYKRLYGLKWKIHYEQHLMKKKYGKNWFSEWEKLRFKKKYGKKWEPHYVKWYFKKYRGATWIYSWRKWQIKQKHPEGSKAYVDEFMRWYFKYAKKGEKALKAWKSATKDLSADAAEKKFRWFYYNLVFQKKQALIKYTKWFYRKKFGKKFLPKYKPWLKKFNANKHWMKYYRLMQTQLAYATRTSSVTVHSIHWFKKKFGSKWRTHYEKYQMKKKYGKNWFSEWEKLRFKKKYGKKWEPHYVKWYFKKYRGATWIYSWRKWQIKQKHKEGSQAYVNDFMRWYFRYKKRGNKAFTKWKTLTNDIPADKKEMMFRWFYYNLVFKKKKALIKYTKWYYRKKYGKKFLPKFKAWEKNLSKTNTWKIQYCKTSKRLKYQKPQKPTNKSKVHKVTWYKKHYGRKWRWYYTRVIYRRRYGRKWRVHFRKWVKKVWKKPSPKRRVVHKVTWYKKHYGRKWRWYYTRVIYRRRYGRKWRVHFRKWVKKVWKKPSPRRRLRKVTWFHRNPGHRWRFHVKRSTHRVKVHSVDWYKKRYGSNWQWFYTRRLYRHRYGSKWRVRFHRWVKTVWRRPAPKSHSVSHARSVSWRTRTRRVVHPIAWFKKHYGANWRWFYTRSRYRNRYGNKWRLHLTPSMRALERKVRLSSRSG